MIFSKNSRDKINKYMEEGNSLFELNNFIAALLYYDKATKVEANKILVAVAFSCKANTLAKLDRYKEALECYDRAIELDSYNADIWVNKGCFLGVLGRAEEALKCFNKAIEIEVQKPEAWLNKGIALQELKRLEDAEHCFNVYKTLS